MRTAEQVVKDIFSEYDDVYDDVLSAVRGRDAEFVEFLEEVLAKGTWCEQLGLLEKCLKELKKGVRR